MRRLRCGSDDGAIAILVAVFAIVLFGFGALIVDLGMARVTRRDAQNAADAAALAAANALYANGQTPDFGAAVTAAKAFAKSNFGTQDSDWSSCATRDRLAYSPAGASACISFDSSTTPANVRVVIPVRHVDSFFGEAVGYQGMDVSARAQSQVGEISKPLCAFCVIGPGTHSLQNGTVTMTDGDVWINGSVSLGPQGGISAPTGTTYIQGSLNRPSQVSDPTQTGVAAITDPLAGLAVPPTDLGSLSSAPKSDPCVDGPGYYGAVSLTGNGTCSLSSGLYVFTEPLSIGGGRSFVANGVTLYFACGVNGVRSSCATDTNPGTLDAGGGGGFTLTALTSGPRKGLAMVYDRGNTARLTVRGNVSGGTVTGTIYAPDASLDLRGTGCGTSFRSMAVIKDLAMNGNPACFSSVYALDDNVDLPRGDTGLVR